MRVALGVAVFSGMIGVTLFGTFFTPELCRVVRSVTVKCGCAAGELAEAELTEAMHAAHSVEPECDGHTGIQVRPDHTGS
jgi:multidrug efflux pump